ncbi:MAG TPA: hypothetical protein VMD27_11230 [Candidatus Aquilonibacter sp.]|nr:hypothetical protein [Candidatus Aquilonibacter sp.]
MDISWKSMSLDEFAAFERSQGHVIIKIRNVHWRRVRHFFYRPMLPFHELSPGMFTAPRGAFWGGIQYAVSPGQKANSFLDLMLFEDTAAYCLDSLERHKKKQVRQAGRHFIIQPIRDLDTFKQKGYPVYLSFYERTHYEYKSERRYEDQFCAWAESIFQFPKVVVLGAFRNRELEAISISKLVENTLIYSTVFCNTESLQFDVTSLLLHSLREAAARHPEVKQIYVGNYKFQGRKGIDEFYFTRGCNLVRKPALLHMNPLTTCLLRIFLPEQYDRLMGNLGNSAGPTEVAAGAISRDSIDPISRKTNQPDLTADRNPKQSEL